MYKKLCSIDKDMHFSTKSHMFHKISCPIPWLSRIFFVLLH